ncbi:MAG: hypothetical protein ACYCYE_01970 [Clostridia bacterium]
MWIVIIILYFVVSYIDTKAFTKLKEKGILPLYIILMVISCVISTASAYVNNMPSPAGPIKNVIKSIIGG